MKTQVCIENYLNGNLSDAKKQAERIARRDLFDALIVAGHSHHLAYLEVNYLKHPSQKTWARVCRERK